MIAIVFALLAASVATVTGQMASPMASIPSGASFSLVGGATTPGTYTRKFDFAPHGAIGTGRTKYGRSFGTATQVPLFPTSSFQKSVCPTRSSGKTYLRASAHVVVKMPSSTCPSTCTDVGMPTHYWKNGGSYWSYVGPGGSGNNGMSLGAAAPAAPTLTKITQKVYNGRCYVECLFEGAASSNAYTSGNPCLTIEYSSSSSSTTDLLHATTGTVYDCCDNYGEGISTATDWESNTAVTSGSKKKRFEQAVRDRDFESLAEFIAPTMPLTFKSKMGDHDEDSTEEMKRRGWNVDNSDANPSMSALWQA